MNENETKVVTRAEKKDAVKALVRELLIVSPRKRTELIDEASKAYVERYPSEDTENVNDVKGRIGSVLDVMKKDGDIEIENGVCALKGKAEEKPKKKTTKKSVKETAVTEEKPVEKKQKKTDKENEKEAKDEAVKEEKPKAKRTTKKVPLPPAPIAPIAPVAPDKPDEPRTIEPKPLPETEKTVYPPKAKRVVKKKTVKEETEIKADDLEVKEEKPKRAIKKKTLKAEENKPVETVTPASVEPIAALPIAPAKAEEKKEEKTDAPAAKEITPAVAVKEGPKAEKKEEKREEKTAKPAPVYDLTAIFGEKRSEQKPREEVKNSPVKTEEKADKKPEEKKANEPIAIEKKEERPVEKKETPIADKPAEKKEASTKVKSQTPAKKPQTSDVKPQTQKTPTAQPKERKPQTLKTQQPKEQPLTADEKLKEAYLDKIHSLGGDYFEYYCVYLLERHARMYGRRLEGLKITGGDHDGGIDGEIELTDGLGFRETVYIQAKNWDPERGNKKLWTVGETCLQQFLGACAYRQAVEGKQQTRGIFITSSRFTPEAKKMLVAMSDKIVGYDCDDLYETAKECSFGLIQKNGEWTLDLNLLSGERAFFRMF